MIDRSALGVGDLLLTRGNNDTSEWIRAGAELEGFDNTATSINHVAVVHHVDEAGTLWLIEGRPGGVGWKDAETYLTSSHTINNAQQPKTIDQRVHLQHLAVGLLGTPYDWAAIIADGMRAIGHKDLWASKQWGPQAPAHVVCSSFADWMYEQVGLESPRPDRTCTPADWAALFVAKGWA
jgi:hypothetical protein